MTHDELFPFITNIPNNTKLLVIGTGAWYSKSYWIENSNVEFELTLRLISPVLQNLILSRNMSIFWQELPPIITAKRPGARVHEWRKYSEKNKLAREILAPTGVHILRTEELLRERKDRDHDRNITHDGLHWSDLGKESVPAFLVSVIMHVAAMCGMRE
eukprot:CAMPEP_0182422820 /NCGR_PEP_ID=MMETSP1167-20130531/8629_1 /TAXON_ID=2988 /ORGANISM="Mallomonas Sp, Strain CCMP3275" /LENGTH=158 /DNA_ID=CAMNT_0024601211 /DNA_START=865 /DNA_END=1341 /DNA_ORIENTATION=+